MKKPVTCFYANFCKYIFRFYFNQHTPNASSPIPYHGNVCVQNRGGLLYDTFILPTSCQRWPAHHLNQALVLQPCVQLESRSYQFQVKYAQQDISAAYLDIKVGVTVVQHLSINTLMHIVLVRGFITHFFTQRARFRNPFPFLTTKIPAMTAQPRTALFHKGSRIFMFYGGMWQSGGHWQVNGSRTLPCIRVTEGSVVARRSNCVAADGTCQVLPTTSSRVSQTQPSHNPPFFKLLIPIVLNSSNIHYHLNGGPGNANGNPERTEIDYTTPSGAQRDSRLGVTLASITNNIAVL